MSVLSLSLSLSLSIYLSIYLSISLNWGEQRRRALLPLLNKYSNNLFFVIVHETGWTSASAYIVRYRSTSHGSGGWGREGRKRKKERREKKKKKETQDIARAGARARSTGGGDIRR